MQPATSASPHDPELLAAALERHQAGRREEAEGLYRRALAADPNEPTALFLLGLLTFETGRADEAAGLFEQVVALRPDHAEAQATLANVRHWLGRHAAAAEAYRCVLALDPTRAAAAIGLCNALREGGDAAGAVEAGQAACAAFPLLPDAHSALAAALTAAGRLEAAVEAYRRAVELDPAQAQARANLAMALLDAGKGATASAEADAAIAADPTCAHAWFVRGAAAMSLRRPEEAATALECASTLDSTRAATQLMLGAAYAELGAAEAAERSLKAALTADPALAEAHASLSSIYLRAGRKDAAASAARRAIALEPAQAEANLNLASLLTEQKRPEEAKRCRDLAYAGRNLLIEPAAEPLATVLMPTTAESGNIPLDHLMPRRRYSRLRWVVEYADAQQHRALPPYDLVFNSIGDPDLAGPTEAPFARFLAECERPVLNRPEAVARTRRDLLPALLGDIPGVMLPAIARLSSATVAELGFAAAAEQAGLAPPLLVRPLGSHGGKGLVLAESRAALDALAPMGESYAIAFHDYRSPDGAYRKYRVVYVDRRPFPYHLAVSRNWMVHYESAGMDADEAARAEELRFLNDPAGALGEGVMAGVAEIGRRLDLDYGGVDFTVLGDGRLMVFEANATMLVHPEAIDGPFAYKNFAVAKIAGAFEAMLKARAAL